MFNIQDIFKERLRQHLRLLNRYLRYIFNGHFMIAILFTLVVLAVYYQQWLSTLSPSFRADLLVPFILSLVTIMNPVQTFLKDPDKVFLIVREKDMGAYFWWASIYNYIMQVYIVVFVLAAITPLMNTAFPVKTTIQYVLIYSFIFLSKYVHLLISWSFLHQSPLFRMIDYLARFLLMYTVLYFAIVEQWVFAGFIFILLIAYVINDFLLFKKQTGLYWEALIENDQQQLAKFYQFASMFAEVPVTKKRQKRRRYLTNLIEKMVPFTREQSFRYLFWLTFIRSSEYMNMYVRLSIIGVLAIIFIPHIWLSIGIGLVFLYLTAFQLLPLFSHYRTLVWLDLYPLRQAEKRHEYMQLALMLCMIQTFIFAGVFIFTQSVGYFFLFIVIGTLFNIAFHSLYVKGKIEKR